MLVNTQQRSQISSSHRLLEATSLFRHRLDLNGTLGSNYIFIDQNFFKQNILTNLVTNLNIDLYRRQQFIIKRTEKLNRVSVCKENYIIEALFDSYFFKNNNKYIDKIKLYNSLNRSIESGIIKIIMPILSRKPLSPIKNKGYYPDIGEINTLIQCYSIAKIISSLSDCQCIFTILADGNKYRRACLTPKPIVDEYQKSLNYWVDYLKLSPYIEIVDYEDWIYTDTNLIVKDKRDFLYRNKVQAISVSYDKFFNPNDLSTLNMLSGTDDIGNQLLYTFWSIITSVNYNSLFSINQHNKLYQDINIQNFYISFICSLRKHINKIKNSHLFSYEIIGDMSSYKEELIIEMRRSAWEAAKRYVSISLVDRELKLLNKDKNDFLKFTIHGKLNEFNFISTNRNNVSRTAQHSVAGIDSLSNSITYKYRIERDNALEKAVYLRKDSGDQFNPLNLLAAINQPIYYQ